LSFSLLYYPTGKLGGFFWPTGHSHWTKRWKIWFIDLSTLRRNLRFRNPRQVFPKVSALLLRNCHDCIFRDVTFTVNSYVLIWTFRLYIMAKLHVCSISHWNGILLVDLFCFLYINLVTLFTKGKLILELKLIHE